MSDNALIEEEDVSLPKKGGTPNKWIIKPDKILLKLNSNEQNKLGFFGRMIPKSILLTGLGLFIYLILDFIIGFFFLEEGGINGIRDHIVYHVIGLFLILFGVVFLGLLSALLPNSEYLYHHWHIEKGVIMTKTQRKKRFFDDKAYALSPKTLRILPKDIIRLHWIKADRAISQTYHSNTRMCYHLEILTKTNQKAIIQLALENPNNDKALDFLKHFQNITNIRNEIISKI